MLKNKGYLLQNSNKSSKAKAAPIDVFTSLKCIIALVASEPIITVLVIVFIAILNHQL